MTDKEILNIFKECRALKEGHFLLSSGLHSGRYLQAASVLKYPDKAEVLCKELVKRLEDKDIDVVLSAAIGGIVLSYEVAKLLGARSIFAERQNGKMTLRRDFSIKSGENVLIVEDVFTTGKSVRELVDIVKKSNASLKAVAVLVDRSKKPVFKDLRFVSLLKLDIKTYEQKECPLCKKGLPIDKPGSRKIFKYL